MKKIILVILMAVTIMTLNGCGKERPNNARIEQAGYGERIIVETVLYENITTEDAG